MVEDEEREYELPASLADNQLAFGGRWRVEDERAVAGEGARLRLRYLARDVFLVLAGRGEARVLVDGAPERVVRVRGDRLYRLVERPQVGVHLLELRFTPVVAEVVPEAEREERQLQPAPATAAVLHPLVSVGRRDVHGAEPTRT